MSVAMSIFHVAILSTKIIDTYILLAIYISAKANFYLPTVRQKIRPKAIPIHFFSPVTAIY